MLSNGISTRLQRLQHHKSSPRVEGMSHMAEYSTLGHRRQATCTRVPTKKGLAADLINKFNQLSAVSSKGSSGSDRLSTIGRATLAAGQQPRKGVRQLFQRPDNATPPASEDESDAASATARDASSSQETRLQQTGDNVVAAYDEDSIVADARDTQPHTSADTAAASGRHEPPAANGRELSGSEDMQKTCPRQSVFLSDSELDRALLEIQEFSRNMNICLADDM
ncbi:hypothetical protein H4R20_006332 [Coemansia guatemalensis]|uniref:Uncharacterized protein n=1 Tax=Coemansia guatemalensis TaxID=2761395 RepID=A0A9W8HPQ4_9FUNG|nr:hypothetical protein H4R20_006332 [Coemansia guatemalensis]